MIAYRSNPPARREADPRPTAYTGPYPILSHRACSEIASLHGGHLTARRPQDHVA